MCYPGTDPRMAGLQEGHLQRIQQYAPDSANFARSTFEAWTAHLVPHLPVLPMFVAMYEAWKRNDFGVFSEHRLVRVPLSIIGGDRIRYRPPIMTLLHEAVLSARMSELAVDTFRASIRTDGLCVLFLCSCGVVFGSCADVRCFYKSDDHSRMDRLRSAIDAEGNPVVEVDTWDALSALPNMDLHTNGAERRLFDRIEELLAVAAQIKPTAYDWIGSELDRMISNAGHTPQQHKRAA